MNPSRKLIRIMADSFLVFVMVVPTRSPMGDIAISAPMEKNSIPTISMTAPSRNSIRISGEIGAMVKLKSSTIRIIGNTACGVSLDFSMSLERFLNKGTNTFLRIIFMKSEMTLFTLQL